MEYNKGEWKYNGKYIDSTDGTRIAEVYNHVCGYTANAHLMTAAPLGYELAELVLAQKADGLDRSKVIYEKAFDFMFKAEGN